MQLIDQNVSLKCYAYSAVHFYLSPTILRLQERTGAPVREMARTSLGGYHCSGLIHSTKK